MSTIGKSTATKQTSGCQGMRGAGHRVSFCGDENIRELDSGDDCTALNVLKTTECTLYKGEFYVAINQFVSILKPTKDRY